MKVFLASALLLVIAVFSTGYGQDVSVQRIPYEFQMPSSPMWGNDVVIHQREATGPLGAAGKSNGTAYVVVPDTTGNRQYFVYKTTNFGNSWVAGLSVGPPREIITKCRLVRGIGDSIYLFYLYRSNLLYINLDKSPVSISQFDSTGIRDFEVVTSSAGGMYLFYDMEANDAIRRAASSDNGATWPQRATVTSGGAFPRVTLNRTAADTMILNYYGPVRAGDTLRSVIRQARYREVAPGNIASAGFIDVDTDTLSVRGEFASIKIGNTVWFFTAKGTTGAIDIQAKVSTDAGVTYGAPFLVAGNPNIDEYWFDVTNYTVGSTGVDLVYYADSLGAAVNTNTDKVMYGYLTKTSPTTVGGRQRISDRPLTWSPRNYKPVMFEYYDADAEVGVVWVGLDGTQRKVYYDRYNSTSTGVNPTNGGIPGTYVLHQNYPNPFNPTTTIAFALPKSEYVTLKVYDLLGREVQTLVAENVNAGSYTARLNAERIASGVYLYQLRAGSFVETKKLTVIK